MDTLTHYKLMREAGKKLYGKVLKVVPKHVFMQVAHEFRFLKKGILVCDENGGIMKITDSTRLFVEELSKKRIAGGNWEERRTYA